MTTQLIPPDLSPPPEPRPQQPWIKRPVVIVTLVICLILGGGVIGALVLFNNALNKGLASAGDGSTQPSVSQPQDTAQPSVGDGNTGTAAEPPAVQTVPENIPPGLSFEEARDWQLVQWDNVVYGPAAQGQWLPPSLSDTTSDWMSAVRAFLTNYPGKSGYGDVAAQVLYGNPWSVNGVVADTNSDLYPLAISGTISVASIGQGIDYGSPGESVRHYFAVYTPAGSTTPIPNTMFKLEWVVSSDGIGHVLISECPTRDPC